MADVRINALATTATTAAADDYLALDGSANGTRKILATNVAQNVTDVTFGTSGPSAKSSIAARAPRQGLVQNGAAGSTFANTAIIGTGAFTYAFWVYQPTANTGDVISGGVGSPGLYINSTGLVGINSVYVAGGPTTSAGAYTAGKWAHIAYVRASTSSNGASYYVNGVAVSTGTDALDYYTAPTAIGKRGDDTNVITGTVVPMIYNRALSASEVVSLYEAGAPAGADYGSPVATNTAISNGTFTGSGTITVTGASATGFTAVGTGFTDVRSSLPSAGWKKGQRFGLRFSATLTSGATPYVHLAQFGSALLSADYPISAGSNYIELVATAAGSGASVGFEFEASATASYAISSLTIIPLGLLLAPDIAQAGGGLTWYDTSGNAANITLPASGVAWAVPSSAKTATGWTFGGNLTVSGTGTSSVAGNFLVSGGSIGVGGAVGSFFDLVQGGNDAYVINRKAGTLLFGSNGNEMQLHSSGNLLLGTSTNSANGKLQLATHTTSAGGIGFGTDTSFFRVGAGELALDGVSGNSPAFTLKLSGVSKSMLFNASGSTYLDTLTAGASIIFRSGNATTALTLDSSQRCILAGALRLNNAYAAGAPTATGYVTIQDSSGTTYKVLVST